MTDDAALGRELLAHGRTAFRVAFAILRERAAAEDAVQEVYARFWAGREAVREGESVRPLLVRAVANAARDLARAENRRRRREALFAREAAGAPARLDADLSARLESALGSLDEGTRLAVELHYGEGMNHAEIASALGIDAAASRKRASRGLARLRDSLAGAGLALAPGAVAGALATNAPTSSAALGARLGGIVSRETRAARTGGALKGGFAMKLVAGVMLAGAVAAGVAVVSGGGSGAPLPAEKPKKFPIPVWHPDARWEVPKESFANNTRLPGVLDGPRREAMQFSVARPHLLGGFVGSGRYVFQSYDERTERFHPATRGARGVMDGPFSRARFSYGDYHDNHMWVRGRGGRFYYVVAGWWTGHVRVLDFAKQTVGTLPVRGCAVSADGESGKVYVVNGRRPVAGVTVLSPGPEWKVLKKQPLQGNQNVNGLGFVLAVDEKRGRLYGRTAYSNKPWYVWYWDIKDGSYHGVLPLLPKGDPGARRQGEAGPFKGTRLYAHGELGWGPDDPEKRYLYVANVDDGALYRMDLDRKILMTLNREGRFVGSGRGIMAAYSKMPLWFEDGSFVGSHGKFPGKHVMFFRRIQ